MASVRAIIVLMPMFAVLLRVMTRVMVWMALLLGLGGRVRKVKKGVGRLRLEKGWTRKAVSTFRLKN